jgi:hypothetical protein
MDPGTVRFLWMALAGVAYAGLLFIAARIPKTNAYLCDALAFTMLILLQPFSQKYTLVVLLWPAMVAGRMTKEGKARMLLYAAAAIAVIQPLINGAAAQRLMQVLGVDFLATALLAAFLTASILTVVYRRSTEQYPRG